MLTIASSPYHFQEDMCPIKVGINDFSNSTINNAVITGPKGDPIATPSHYWYILLLKVKCTFFIHKSKSSFIFFLLIFVYNSPSSYVLLSIILIV